MSEQLGQFNFNFKEELRQKVGIKEWTEIHNQLINKVDADLVRSWIKDYRNEQSVLQLHFKNECTNNRKAFDDFVNNFYTQTITQSENNRKLIMDNIHDINLQLDSLSNDAQKYQQDLINNIKEYKFKIKNEYSKLTETVEKNIESINKRVCDQDFIKMDKKTFIEKVKEL